MVRMTLFNGCTDEPLTIFVLQIRVFFLIIFGAAKTMLFVAKRKRGASFAVALELLL